MFTVRLAKCSDAPELKRLNDLFNGAGCNTAEAIKRSLVINDNEIVCVVEMENGLAGFCCAQAMSSMCYSDNYAEITELFVSENYRRQGVGRNLINFIETELSKRGVKHIHILTGKDNAAAQELYYSCEYKETSEILLDKNIQDYPAVNISNEQIPRVSFGRKNECNNINIINKRA